VFEGWVTGVKQLIVFGLPLFHQQLNHGTSHNRGEGDGEITKNVLVKWLVSQSW
jgi:hypothetical protein